MKALEFKHQNVVFAKDQPEYIPLPALRLDSPEGEVITCWGLSLKDRIKIIFTGKIWLSMMTFNKPLTPVYMSANRKEIYLHTDDNKSFLYKIVTKIKNKLNHERN